MFNHFGAKKQIRKLFFDRFLNYVQNGIPNQTPPIPPLNLTELKSDDVYIPTVYWRNVERREPTNNKRHYLQFFLDNVTTKQKSFTGGRTHLVGTRYTTNGVVTVEIYFSKSAYQTADEEKLSTVVQRTLLQQNVGSIWFRNPVIVDLDAEENYFRTNVVAEYEYDSEIT